MPLLLSHWMWREADEPSFRRYSVERGLPSLAGASGDPDWALKKSEGRKTVNKLRYPGQVVGQSIPSSELYAIGEGRTSPTSRAQWPRIKVKTRAIFHDVARRGRLLSSPTNVPARRCKKSCLITALVPNRLSLKVSSFDGA